MGSKIIADGDCSHEIKRCLFLGRKTMTNLDSILKSRDREQDGREVGGCGLHLSHRIHQKNIFRHTIACRTPAESGQEDLTSGKEYQIRSVTQSCPTLCDPMNCSPPGTSVHGDSPGKNTGMGCHALLQRIFLTQGLNPGLPHCRQILYCLSHQGSPLGTLAVQNYTI